jgi:hypothetical protein
MDERHWWIATRLAQAFSFENTTGYIEKFICDLDNLEKINNFLCSNGTNKLFCASLKLNDFSSDNNNNNNNNQISIRSEDSQHAKTIYLIENVLKLPKQIQENLDQSIILYFLRHDTTQEVSQSHIFKDVYCGEIKNVSQILFNVYNDLFLNLLNTNQTWSTTTTISNNLIDNNNNYNSPNSNSSIRAQSVRNMEKYINGLNEISSLANQNQKNMLLKRVDPDALDELKQPRISPDSQVIRYCEDLAQEWIITIENILSDICDERLLLKGIKKLN